MTAARKRFAPLVGFAAVAAGVAALTAAVGPQAVPVRAVSAQDYAELPLAFVPNAGQNDARVRYSAQVPGAAFAFTQRGAVLAFTKQRKQATLQLDLVGANPRAAIVGRRPAQGRVNYLVGADPARWHTNLPTYGEIAYTNAWRGVDVIFRGAKGRLKYELVVQPGGDLEDVALAYRGARGLRIAPSGALLIDTQLGTLRDQRPFTYQVVNGERVRVASRYVLADGGTSYRFEIGAFDRRLPLVVDPGIDYSTYLGGNGYDQALGITVDSGGNAYVVGYTDSANFPTTGGAFDPVPNGGDAFVTKLDPTGSSLVFSTYLGGSAFEGAYDVALDSSGAIYLTGETASSDFPTTVGAFDTVHNGGNDAYVVKLDPSGASLAYATFLGGTAESFGGGAPYTDVGFGIAVDSLGNALVSGYTSTTNFPTASAAQPSYGGGAYDAYATKLNATGASLVYSTYLGGSSGDAGFGHNVAVDPAGNAYLSISTGSANFPTTGGSYDTTFDGGNDAAVVKLSPLGALLYSTFVGGSGDETPHGIDVDASGNATFGGITSSVDFPVTGSAAQPAFAGGAIDAFVARLDPTGTSLQYGTYLGGSGFDYGGYAPGVDVAVDAAGNTYVVGTTHSADFPLANALDSTVGGVDAWVAKLGPSGSLDFSTYLGGGGTDVGHGIDTLGGRAYVTGFGASGDFPTTGSPYDTSANGGFDGFVVKLDPGTTVVTPVPTTLTLTPAAATNPVGTSHTLTARVEDQNGSPVAGVAVRFTVTGAVSTSGSCTTLANGECTFMYTGPSVPGSDAISAFADSDGDTTADAGEPTAAASKSWVLATSTPGCKVSNGGRITAANGDKATFGGEAKVSAAGAASGQQTYQDHGPAQSMTVKSTAVAAVVCSGNTATIYGTASIDGGGAVAYVLTVVDNGEPGKSDTYSLVLANGYASGVQTLEGGNVQVK